jgi:hypothetical protein
VVTKSDRVCAGRRRLSGRCLYHARHGKHRHRRRLIGPLQSWIGPRSISRSEAQPIASRLEILPSDGPPYTAEQIRKEATCISGDKWARHG